MVERRLSYSYLTAVETAAPARKMPSRIVLVLIAALLLGACQGGFLQMLPLGPLRPYKIDVQQGNVVTQEMISKVQPGMSRGQVRFALGTPLVEDVFHKDRWDYVYLYQKGGEATEHRRIVVVFKDDKLVRIDGDVVAVDPAKAPKGTGKPAASAPAPSPAAAAPAPAGDTAKPAVPAGEAAAPQSGTP